MLLRYLPLNMRLKILNILYMHNRKQLVVYRISALHSLIYPVTFIWKPDSIVYLLFINCTICPLFANILSSGFHTKPVSINELRLNVLNTKHLSQFRAKK